MTAAVRRLKLGALEKGPGGRYLCRWCRQEVPPPRRTFCSVACVQAWRLRSDPQHVRRLVKERDKEVCRQCGRDCADLARRAWLEPRQPRQEFVELDGLLVPLYRHLWEADHIVEVADGGGLCGLDNYQTLCRWCHVAKTTESRRRRALAPKERA